MIFELIVSASENGSLIPSPDDFYARQILSGHGAILADASFLAHLLALAVISVAVVMVADKTDDVEVLGVAVVVAAILSFFVFSGRPGPGRGVMLIPMQYVPAFAVYAMRGTEVSARARLRWGLFGVLIVVAFIAYSSIALGLAEQGDR